MLSNTGKPLDANFSVDSDTRGLSVILESRGAGRNQDYSAALTLILARLGALGAILDSVHLERARNETRPEPVRRVETEDISFPVNLSTVHDFEDLRRRISRAQAALGRNPGASGPGNGTKRIRIRLSALDIELVELRATLHGFDTVVGNDAVSRSPLSVTSLDAVLAAMNEFDLIGRDAFLRKYGYREAVSYFIAQNERHYDTKAIIGAAFGYQHNTPPLANDEFSGGKATVEKALKRMGLRVERTKKLASPRRRQGGDGRFAILATPHVYDIERAIQVLDLDTWTLDSNKVEVGDQIVIWKAQGNGQRRGVVAFAEVVGGVEERPPYPGSEKFFIGTPEVGTARRFLMRYQVPDGLPLWLGVSDEIDAVLESLSVSDAQGNKRYKVTDEQWKGLHELVNLEAKGGGPNTGRPPMRLVPVETATKESFPVSAPDSEPRLAKRSESVLVDDFKQWLTKKGLESFSALYDIPGGTLRADLFIRDWNLLVEAKATSSRGNIRTAIGQLFDYRRFHDPVPRLAVLVPRKPEEDLLKLLQELGIKVWCRDGDGFANH